MPSQSKRGLAIAPRLVPGLRPGLGIALLGSALLVDPYAEAAFDAPKRACVIVGALVASLGLLSAKQWLRWSDCSRMAKVAVICAALAAIWVFCACVLSPHPALAWNSLRRAVFFAAFIPLGASRAVTELGTRTVLALFATGCVVNIAVSLAQSAGWTLPLDVVQIGGRFATGALLGNEGYVALAAALLASVCVVVAAGDSALRVRLVAAATAIASVIVIAINHQATSALALIAALVVSAAIRWRMRWLAAAIIGLVAIAAVTALIAPLREMTWAAFGDVDAYQRLTTYRLGAWVAALHMIGTRPLVGYGLGSFAAEQQVHRLAAEISLQQRFVQPTASSFIYAHDDYLQLAAEAGIPALLLVLVAIGIIMIGLARVGRPATDIERLSLLALLTAGAVAALAWFPLQIPFTAVALLLALGRAWRVVAEEAAR